MSDQLSLYFRNSNSGSKGQNAVSPTDTNLDPNEDSTYVDLSAVVNRKENDAVNNIDPANQYV